MQTTTLKRSPRRTAPTFVLLLALLLTSLASLTACADRSDSEAPPAQAAWELIDQGALVLDVRSPEEFDGGHLPGAVRVDFDDTEALQQAIGEDRDRSVVLYCGSGRRAGKAIDALEAEGYNALFNGMGYKDLMADRP